MTGRDFTLFALRRLITAARSAGYAFVTFRDFLTAPPAGRVVVLRHDVDRRPECSVATAELERQLDVVGTYYFRALPCSFDIHAIQRIERLCHEIGYHYEDFAVANGNHERALKMFEDNLARFRAVSTIDTICMHGSPMSKWDNRQLWGGAADYRRYSVLGEPYMDVDYSRVGYLTDTGRRWDGHAVNVRDHVSHSVVPQVTTTQSVVEAFRTGILPDALMITIHPQRWTDSVSGWVIEAVGQSCRNLVKRAVVSRRAAPGN